MARQSHELLKQVHIFPDVEAFTVVYALNPNIQELRELKVLRYAFPDWRVAQNLRQPLRAASWSADSGEREKAAIQ